MSKPRRHFAGTEKVAIIKRHLLDKVPVSNLCDELKLYPNQFYQPVEKGGQALRDDDISRKTRKRLRASPRFSTGFYGWLKEFFENGHAACDNGRQPKAAENAKDQKIEQLEARLTRKNEVMAELMEAHVELKKSLGEP